MFFLMRKKILGSQNPQKNGRNVYGGDYIYIHTLYIRTRNASADLPPYALCEKSPYFSALA